MHRQEPNPLDEIVETFEEFEEWDEKSEYLIELGRDLPEFPEADRIKENMVDGCQSQVWMTLRPTGENHEILIEADSDSLIVKGLIAILLAAYNRRTPDAIAAFDAEGLFENLGLQQLLSPMRRNGLFSMVKRIREAVRPG